MLSLCAVAFSFTKKPGGDVFEIYLNGKQMHQQFVHVNNSVKILQFAPVNSNDKVEVFYSHCGHIGTNRVIAIRNDKDELLKEWKFADENSRHSLMAFYRKDIPKTSRVKLYYSSREMPEGKLLAVLTWSESKVVAKL